MRIERALPERDASPISRLIETCREERRTVLNGFTPEEERAYLESMGPREQVFVAYMDGKFAGFAGIAPRWSYSERLSHCGEGGDMGDAGDEGARRGIGPVEGGDIPLLQRERTPTRRGLRDGPQQRGYLLLREPRIPGLWTPQQPRRLGR